jgi:hypothetical protein
MAEQSSSRLSGSAVKVVVVEVVTLLLLFAFQQAFTR